MVGMCIDVELAVDGQRMSNGKLNGLMVSQFSCIQSGELLILKAHIYMIQLPPRTTVSQITATRTITTRTIVPMKIAPWATA
jgi:hypothetical protein